MHRKTLEEYWQQKKEGGGRWGQATILSNTFYILNKMQMTSSVGKKSYFPEKDSE